MGINGAHLNNGTNKVRIADLRNEKKKFPTDHTFNQHLLLLHASLHASLQGMDNVNFQLWINVSSHLQLDSSE